MKRLALGTFAALFLGSLAILATGVLFRGSAYAQSGGWTQDCLGELRIQPIAGGNTVICGDGGTATPVPTTPAPTNTSVPPTNTPAPPTNTPVPPTATATAVPPTPTPAATPVPPSGPAMFSADIELNGHISGQVDMITVFNPAGSGKNLVFQSLQLGALGTLAHYDLRPIVTAGGTSGGTAGCQRHIQIKPDNLTGPIASVAVANSRCSPTPENDLAWEDGPMYQFTADSTMPIFPLGDLVAPPGHGLTVRTDSNLLSGSTVFFHIVWIEE